VEVEKEERRRKNAGQKRGLAGLGHRVWRKSKLGAEDHGADSILNFYIFFCCQQ